MLLRPVGKPHLYSKTSLRPPPKFAMMNGLQEGDLLKEGGRYTGIKCLDWGGNLKEVVFLTQMSGVLPPSLNQTRRSRLQIEHLKTPFVQIG